MSYLRPIRQDELVTWLESIDYEALTTNDLAKALINRFDVLTQSHSAT